jgi:hypothetical protein
MAACYLTSMNTVTTTSSMQYATIVREAGNIARELGLVAPSFQSPPRVVGVDRTIGLSSGRLVVRVRLRDRAPAVVAFDVACGLFAANRVPLDDVEAVAERLVSVVGAVAKVA